MIRSNVSHLMNFIVFVVLLVSSVTDLAQTPPPSQNQSTSPTSKRKAVPGNKSAVPAPPKLEPKAIEILKATSERLVAARTISFSAVELFESSSRQGHPLVYATKYEVTLQRPDKLRVITSADGPASEFYYDGKTMMAFSPAENLVAVADAPPTIDSALEAAYHSAAIYFPFTDIIVADPYKDMSAGLKLAYYVGQSHVVGETTTDIVAFSGNGLFAEVWIGTEDKLPLAIHAVYLDDPAQLRHNLLFSNWQLDAAVPADAFTSSKAASAKRIQFAHPNPEPPPGAQPAAKRKPTQTPHK
jgi:hypothetical protein